MTTRRSRRNRAGLHFGRIGAVVVAVGLVAFVSAPAAGATTLAGPAAGATALAAPAVSADPALPTAGLNYVALGDSYSSGLGVAPQTDEPVAGCGQSSNNYPHQIAAELGFTLTDVTCAGATAANVTTTPQQIFAADGTTLVSTAPVQTDVLSASTDVVTITVGGNNLKFTQVAALCAAASATGPLLLNLNFPDPAPATCQAEVQALLGTAFPLVQQALDQTYAAVKLAAPNAKIFVLGYPSIAPAVVPPAGCFSTLQTPNSFPFTTADTPFLHGVETQLDGLVQTEALKYNFSYVPTFADSTGHSACAAPADQYVNGVYLTGATDPHTGFPVIDEKSLHPNAAGVDFMADTLEPMIAAAFPPTVVTPTPTPTPTPSVSAPATEPATSTGAASASLAATGLSEPFIAGASVLALLFMGAGLSALIMQRKQRSHRR